ncbi:hypothetical protein ANCDUO_25934 [Ancylostoma duodenale]|uniref:Uncharacterized protein n=1 Tax=Ancylostoma duodenale TaxID=51022 RepID=A0A0C2C355_9BILA|nr:hypothetical protein ANCDUO_25934 [Ancylostoma duodenale]
MDPKKSTKEKDRLIVSVEQVDALWTRGWDAPIWEGSAAVAERTAAPRSTWIPDCLINEMTCTAWDFCEKKEILAEET